MLFLGGIYESTHRWEYVFYYISGLNILGGLLMFSITLVLRHKRKQKAEKLRESSKFSTDD